MALAKSFFTIEAEDEILQIGDPRAEILEKLGQKKIRGL